MPLKQEEISQNTNKTVQIRDFKGVNQTDLRTGIDDAEFAWLENMVPIGKGNLHAVHAPGTTVGGAVTNIFSIWGFVLNAVPIIITINSDGSVSQINLNTNAVTAVAAASSVTTSCRVAIWQSTTILFIDPTKGYFSWDGTTFLTYPISCTGDTHSNNVVDNLSISTTGLQVGMAITGSGIPASTTIASITGAHSITISNAATTSVAGDALTIGPTGIKGSALAVFEGRVWIVGPQPSRTITFSAPASFTDFTITSGAGSTTISDSAFLGNITNLLSTIEQLYVVGAGAVDTISNVSTAGSPLATTFSVTNIVTNVGSIFPSSISAYLRAVFFQTPYGVYSLVGTTPQKISDKLDNLYPDLILGTDEPAAVGAVHHILTWCLLTTFADPGSGVGSMGTKANRPLLLCFAGGKWFFASVPNLTYITSVLISGTPKIYGTTGVGVFPLFDDPTTAQQILLTTKLYDFGDSTQMKELKRFGLEIQSDQVVSPTITLENEQGNNVVTSAISANTLTWVGLGGNTLTFTGAGSVAIVWLVSGLQLLRSGTVSQYGDYLGMTISGNLADFALGAVIYEVRPGGKWNSLT